MHVDDLGGAGRQPEKFHPAYDAGMWRRWRRAHLDYVHKLLPTVNAIPSALLEELTKFSLDHEPAIVRDAALELFSGAASNSRPPEDLETAALFFSWLIRDVTNRPKPRPIYGDARTRMTQWFLASEPLAE
jgi:hypothetical protein